MKRAAWTLLFATLPLTAHAVIERMYSLKEVLDESTNVLVGKIDKVDQKNLIAVARVERPLKGGREYSSVQMNFSVGQPVEGRYLTEHFREGDPFVLFYSRNGDEIASLGHAGDIWFQLFATHEQDASRVWWRFTHIETYMGRTFDGATEDLMRLTDDVIARRRAPPAPNPKVQKFDLGNAPRPGQRRARGGVAGAPITLIPRGARWKYLKGREAPVPAKSGIGWTPASFDDAGWTAGAAPLGYGDGEYGTTLDDMQTSAASAGYSSVYLRGRFEAPDPSSLRDVNFEIDYDDGFILWLNGKRAFAANVPAGEPGHDALAPANHESGAFESFALEQPDRFLIKGENVAALQVFNRDLKSSDLKIELEATARVASPSSRDGAFRQSFELEASAGGEIRGISWADIDGDTRLDALFCRSGGNVLLLNDARGWRPAGKELGAAEGSRSAGWADQDGDGRADLLTSGFRILRGAPKKMPSVALPAPGARNPEGAGWIDADGDGLPDALITNGEHGVLLYRNTGKDADRFLDVSAAAGLGPAGLGKGNGDFVAFADFDGDGFTDFLYNLQGGTLARNTGGAFVAEARTGIELPGGDAWKRGVAFADYDNDMDLDLFVPSPEKPRLYRNNNDGTFTDILDRSGALAESADPTCSGAWGDVNHDGFLDLLVCRPGASCGLYLGDGKGRLRDGGERLPAGFPPAFAASFADADGDGDLDVAVNREGSVAIALNEVEKDPGRAPVTVRALAPRGVVGSTVRAYDATWRRLGMRQLALAEGWGGQAPPVAHLALPVGDCRVTICLSDGRAAAKIVNVPKQGIVLTFRDEDFKE